jgi:hypothetical protein
MCSPAGKMAQQGRLIRRNIPPRAPLAITIALSRTRRSECEERRHASEAASRARGRRRRRREPIARALSASRFLRCYAPSRGELGQARRAVTHSPGSCSNLHPEDYINSINFNKCLDFVRFCDLSRTSPTGFRTQTLLTEFGLTCHARRVRAHWRAPLASIGFVRITWRRATGNHARSCVARGWHRSKNTSSLARSTSAPLPTNALPAPSGERYRRKTLTEDVRWLLRGSISKKADGGCTSSSSGRSSRSA